jgi:hypothetical protein
MIARRMINGKCNPIYNREYYLKNKEKLRELHRKRLMDARIEVINLLGGKCVICGFSDIRALQIDHINGGGCKERNEFREQYYIKIKKKILAGSKEYQLLCANHNWIKRYERGEC